MLQRFPRRKCYHDTVVSTVTVCSACLLRECMLSRLSVTSPAIKQAEPAMLSARFTVPGPVKDIVDPDAILCGN